MPLAWGGDVSRRRYAYTLGGVPLPEPIEVSEDYHGGDGRSGALIMCDRFMEGTTSPIDGTDIGSRAKRREHMRAHGLADASDYSPGWYEKKARERTSAPVVSEADVSRAYDRLRNRRP